MNELEFFINDKLAEITKRLPELVHENPASFSCGFNAGYKAALLDLSRIMENKKHDQ